MSNRIIPYTDERLGRVLIMPSVKGEPPLPYAKPLGESGKYVCRHNTANVSALRARGLEVPGIHKGYGWPGKFDYYVHQCDTARHLAENRRSWCTNGLRSGKTSSAALAVDLIKSCDELPRDAKILVLCPINIMYTAWHREMGYIDKETVYFVTGGNTKAVKRALKDGEVQVLIMNDDKLSWLTDEIDEWDPDLIIVDEAHRFKTDSTDRYKCLLYLTNPLQGDKYAVSRRRRLWLLTGTPVPNSPVDMYHLQKLIDPTTIPSSEKEWLAMTCLRIEKQVSRTKVVYDYIPRDNHEQLVADAMQPCIRYRTQDCVDLPPQAYNEYLCPLSSKQRQLIKQLMNKYAAMDETEPDKTVIAANAAVRVSKILQICTGSVISEEGHLDVGAPEKFKQLLDLIRQNTGKTLVFCIYKGAQRWLKAELKRKRISAEIVNGDVPPSKKVGIVDKFQMRSTPEVLILHPQSRGHDADTCGHQRLVGAP